MKTFLEFLAETNDFLARRKAEDESLRTHAKSINRPFWNDQPHYHTRDDGIASRLHAAHDFTKLHPDTQKHVKNFSGMDSSGVNNHLWQKSQGKRSGNASKVRSMVSHLDKATSAHSAPEDFHVYSGVQFDPRTVQNKDAVKVPGFISASLNASSASHHARGTGDDRHILKINVKKGQKGFFVGDHSHEPKEQEFLLPRNKTLKINPTPELHVGRKGHLAEPATYHLWHAEIVDDEK